jgi:hypothetical protein
MGNPPTAGHLNGSIIELNEKFPAIFDDTSDHFGVASIKKPDWGPATTQSNQVI